MPTTNEIYDKIGRITTQLLATKDPDVTSRLNAELISLSERLPKPRTRAAQFSEEDEGTSRDFSFRGLLDRPARTDQEREAWIDRMVAELRAYSQAGGDILFGTDIGYIDHYDTALEFTLMSQAGMNYQQILASLTTNPARRFHYSDRTGHIAKGMEADLVILSADPSRDVTAFSKVRYTIRNGKVIYSSK